jgi:surface antigen
MQKAYSKVAFILLVASLTGCSGGIPGFSSSSSSDNSKASSLETKGVVGTSVDEQGREKNVNVTMTGGSEIGLRSMDSEDKSKMSHALDAGTGKPSHWENGATGIGYTVTPTRKVEVQGNPFCREYSVTANKGSFTRTMIGTACVTTDGSWHAI